MTKTLIHLNRAADEQLKHWRTLRQDFARFDTARDTAQGKSRAGSADNKVSKADLKAVVDSVGTKHAKDFSQADVEAARFLLDHPKAMNTLDTAAHGGHHDEKISREDVDAALPAAEPGGANKTAHVEAASSTVDDVKNFLGDTLSFGMNAGRKGLNFLHDKTSDVANTLSKVHSVGDLINVLPFNNSAEAATKALLGQDRITLDKDAIAEIKHDPAFVAHEKKLIEAIKARPEYGDGKSFSVPLADLDVDKVVEFGGKRGKESMGSQLKHIYDFTDPDVRATLKVAGNDLTWLLRHATVGGTAHVDQKGNIKIDYEVSDKLDLRPGKGRTGAYNTTNQILGTIWHDVLGAKEARVVGDFSVEHSAAG